MNEIIDQEYIKPLIESGKLSKLDRQACQEFNDFISNIFPWYGIHKDRIDWGKIDNHKQLSWMNATDNDIYNFLKSSSIGNYEELAIIFSSSQSGLIGNFKNVIENLGAFNAHCPWIFFLVGVKKDKYGIYCLQNEDCVEFFKFNGTMTTKNN